MPNDEKTGRPDERGRREGQGPSVFPEGPGNRQMGEDRDPEEEGSAGKTQR